MKKVLSIILSLFILSAVFLIGGYIFIRWQIKQTSMGKGAEKDFIISSGEGARSIAQRLQRERIIKSDFYFLFYLWQKGWMDRLKAGEYHLRSDWAISKIAEVFYSGAIKPNWVEVTIPEGFRLKQIDARLAVAGLIQNGDLIAFNAGLKFSQPHFFVFGEPLKDLEGFLFPDTYRFEKNASRKVIIEKMLANFEKKVDYLRPAIKEQNKTIYQIITMASILEKEVKTEEDWKIVSGVFWRRLKNNQPLESCATIAYILGLDKWRYSYADTRQPSPYNTYLNRGLPPTPINNPGLKTIEAALYPVATDYNFFLTDPATDKTIFSRTLEEHNRNKARYLD